MIHILYTIHKRCGELSQACERFFIQEACFYECDPNVGLWRYQGNHSWKIYGMPIKADYCDAWYRACYNDLFCASDGGSYYSCAMEYAAADAAATDDHTLDIILGVMMAVIVMIVIGLLGFICFVRNREKRGNPYFAPLDTPINSPDTGNKSRNAEEHELQETR